VADLSFLPAEVQLGLLRSIARLFSSTPSYTVSSAFWTPHHIVFHYTAYLTDLDVVFKRSGCFLTNSAHTTPAGVNWTNLGRPQQPSDSTIQHFPSYRSRSCIKRRPLVSSSFPRLALLLHAAPCQPCRKHTSSGQGLVSTFTQTPSIAHQSRTRLSRLVEQFRDWTIQEELAKTFSPSCLAWLSIYDTHGHMHTSQPPRI